MEINSKIKDFLKSIYGQELMGSSIEKLTNNIASKRKCNKFLFKKWF